MRDEFNEISFILNIRLFKSTQNLKKQKKNTKQNHCHNDDNHTFLITLTVHTKLHGLKLFEKKNTILVKIVKSFLIEIMF